METGDRALLYRVSEGQLRLDTEAGEGPWGEETVVVRVLPA